MVLGVAWLQTLGTILWNFQELSMQFVNVGQKIMLKGLIHEVHIYFRESNEYYFQTLSKKIHFGIFFYDILVYSSSEQQHPQHLKLTLDILR